MNYIATRAGNPGNACRHCGTLTSIAGSEIADFPLSKVGALTPMAWHASAACVDPGEPMNRCQ